MSYPLEGLKVLDFSRVLAGPFAARMLSDLGADVIKVEPPDGDVTRYWGVDTGNITSYYNQHNAGKRNICIDLQAPGASDLVKKLVKEADIVMENYRPDVMPRLGIGYADLKAVNPKLIMLSISGFGHNSPESRRPAYAPVIHAETGLINRMRDKFNTHLHDLPLNVADTTTGLHGLVGLLAAVIMRDRTGLGQHIDIAMIDAIVATDDQLQYDLDGSQSTGPLESQIWDMPFGAVLLSTDFRILFKMLTTELGLVDPANKEMDLPTKIASRRRAVGEFFRSISTIEQFADMMTRINIAWGEVRQASTLRDQITIKARGSITQVDDRAGGTRHINQSPYRFSDAQAGVRFGAPHRGEHNKEVLQSWIATSAAEVSKLHSEGVLIFDADWKHH